MRPLLVYELTTSTTAEQDTALCVEGWEPFAVISAANGRGWCTHFRRISVGDAEASVGSAEAPASTERSCLTCRYLHASAGINRCAFYESVLSTLDGCDSWEKPD